MAWTEERTAELKKLWGEGHSASQIAKHLGGVTRNAVIGKVHGLGLKRGQPADAPRLTKKTKQPAGLAEVTAAVLGNPALAAFHNQVRTMTETQTVGYEDFYRLAFAMEDAGFDRKSIALLAYDLPIPLPTLHHYMHKYKTAEERAGVLKEQTKKDQGIGRSPRRFSKYATPEESTAAVLGNPALAGFHDQVRTMAETRTVKREDFLSLTFAMHDAGFAIKDIHHLSYNLDITDMTVYNDTIKHKTPEERVEAINRVTNGKHDRRGIRYISGSSKRAAAQPAPAKAMVRPAATAAVEGVDDAVVYHIPPAAAVIFGTLAGAPANETPLMGFQKFGDVWQRLRAAQTTLNIPADADIASVIMPVLESGVLPLRGEVTFTKAAARLKEALQAGAAGETKLPTNAVAVLAMALAAHTGQSLDEPPPLPAKKRAAFTAPTYLGSAMASEPAAPPRSTRPRPQPVTPKAARGEPREDETPTDDATADGAAKPAKADKPAAAKPAAAVKKAPAVVVVETAALSEQTLAPRDPNQSKKRDMSAEEMMEEFRKRGGQVRHVTPTIAQAHMEAVGRGDIEINRKKAGRPAFNAARPPK